MPAISNNIECMLRWGLLLFIFLLPWQTRYIFAEYGPAFPLYGDASLYATDILFIIIFALYIIWMMQNKRWLAMKNHSHKISGAFELLLAWAAISVLWSAQPMVSALVWLRLLQTSLLILMLATGPVKRHDVVVALVSSGVVQGLLALAQFFTQSVFANTWLGMAAQSASRLGASVIEQGEFRWLRAYGSLPHPNILGGWLVGASLSAIYLYLAEYRNKYWSAVVSLAAFMIIFAGLLVTFSRSAWMGFVAGSLILLAAFISTEEKSIKSVLLSFAKLTCSAALVLFAFNGIFGNLWLSRVTSQDRLTTQSAMERKDLMDQAQTVIANHGMKGAGIGAYPGAIMELNTNQPSYAYQPVHNVWLLLYAELGLAGLALLILWMSCWYVFLKSLFSRKFLREKALPFAFIFAAGLMAYFDHFWWTLPVGLMAFAIPVGLSLRKNS